MFRRVVAADANIRQVQPIVRTDHSDAPAQIAQPLIELRGNEAFTAPVDSRNSDKRSASLRRCCSGADDCLDQLAQAGHFAGVSHPLVAWIVRSVLVVIQAAIAPGFSWLLEGALVIFILSTGGPASAPRPQLRQQPPLPTLPRARASVPTNDRLPEARWP